MEYVAIDLFAGAGGLSVGAKDAGIRVAIAVELDPTSCQTLRANPRWHGCEVVEQDVRELCGADLRSRARVDHGDKLLVIGGPPCQPFSKAAYWTDTGEEARYRRARAAGQRAQRPTSRSRSRPDERRSLVDEFARLAVEADADGFLFENVPSLLHPRNRHTLEEFLDRMEQAGYATRVARGNALAFGVAQSRERIFVLGSRERQPDAPVPSRSTNKGELLLPNPVTAGEAIAAFATADFFEQEEIITGRWAHLLETIPPGWNYKAHTAWGGHPKPTFETETRYWNFLLKLSPDKPSWTIPANPGPWTGPFHWDNRRLRTPELAALQGFPADYNFCGSRRERVRQIGNAVPAPMASEMLRCVVAAMGMAGTSRVSAIA